MSSITFGQTLQHSNPSLVVLSPDGTKVASTLGQRLIVRAFDDSQIIPGGLQPCMDKIEYLEWSSDSNLVLCAMYKRGLVQVFSLTHENWHCRIREGIAGMVRATWCPDSRHILTFSDYQLHLSIWSLVSQQLYQIKQVKNGGKDAVAFSPNGSVMAVASRRDVRDYVGLYNTTNWEVLNEFSTATLDLASIQWAPDGTSLLVQDSCLEYAVLFYSAEGTLLRRYQAYEHALGVKTAAFSPERGGMLAVGSYDEMVRLLAPGNWRPVAELNHVHPKQQPGSAIRGKGVETFREVVAGEEELEPEHFTLEVSMRKMRERAARGSSKRFGEVSYITALPNTLPSERPDPNKANPKLGVGLISWSHDGKYLATRNDNMPRVLWIWSAEFLSLVAILQQRDPIRSAKWSPLEATIAICTGSRRVYFWNTGGPSWVDLPTESEGFDIRYVRWHPDGERLLLLTKDRSLMMHWGGSGQS
ncbi:unnamed protein product [Chrysoparadoxa australica]